MNRNLILLTEKSLAQQARFWSVIIFDQHKQPVAAACLSLFRTDMLQSAPKKIQQIMQQLRRRRPNLCKIGVLFCGLPAPCASSHLRIIDEAHVKQVLRVLHSVMKNIAKTESASLIVFKELNQQQLKQQRLLKRQGFLQGSIAPMHELRGDFVNFHHYQNTLRSRYRQQVKQNLKKFSLPDIRVCHISDPHEIYRQFTDEVYQLYVAVWQRSSERLEQFPAFFFRELGHALPGKTTLTLIYQGEKPIAFTISVHSGQHYHNLYCGLDYAIKDDLDLYFNLFYRELDQAFKRNVQTIYLGQTSDYFKSRLGTVATPRYFLVRAKNLFAHIGLKLFKRFIFPEAPIVSQQHVFKELT